MSVTCLCCKIPKLVDEFPGLEADVKLSANALKTCQRCTNNPSDSSQQPWLSSALLELQARLRKEEEHNALLARFFPQEGTITIKNLVGKAHTLKLRLSDRIIDVRKRIGDLFEVPASKAILLWRGQDVVKELKAQCGGTLDPSTIWKDLGVPWGSDLKILHLMHNTNEDGSLSHNATLLFSLNWDRVMDSHIHIRDRHMDGVCLVVRGTASRLQIDKISPFQNQFYSGIMHHGKSQPTLFDHQLCQKLSVTMSQIPSDAHALYFALCSSGRLSTFRGITVKLTDKTSGEVLAEEHDRTKVQSGSGRALMLCCARRSLDAADEWSVYKVGKDTNGWVSERVGSDWEGLKQLVIETEREHD